LCGHHGAMPIYEYVCDTCGKEVEVLQKFSDPPLTRCTCSKHGRLKRKLSATAFHLQGGGWYSEGYSGKKNGNTPADSGAGKSGDSPAAKSDASAKQADASGAKSEAAGKKGETSGAKSQSKASSAATA